MTAPPRRERHLADALSLPVVSGRRLVYVSDAGNLVVRQLGTGRLLWQAEVQLDRVLLDGEPAPVVAGNVICVRYGDDGYRDNLLYGFALDDGERLWTSHTDESQRVSPVVADGLLLVGDDSGNCYALSAKSGERRWRARVSDQAVDSAAQVAGDMVFVPTSDGIVTAVDLATGMVRFPAVTGGSVSAGLAVSRGTLLAAACTRLVAVDCRTGERRWRRRLGSWLERGLATRGSTAVACAGRGIHSVAVANGRPRWERELDGEVTSPLVSGDVVLVATKTPPQLHALSFDDGHSRWSVSLDGAPYGAPVAAPGRVLVLLESGIDVWRYGP